MKFAILCFEKCGPTAPDAVAQSKNGPVIWQVLTATVKELCVDVILKHLVQGGKPGFQRFQLTVPKKMATVHFTTMPCETNAAKTKKSVYISSL